MGDSLHITLVPRKFWCYVRAMVFVSLRCGRSYVVLYFSHKIAGMVRGWTGLVVDL